MFRPALNQGGEPLSFTFNGQPMTARPGDTVAAALLANEVSVFRSSAISGRPRGPYCMMGVCFECLLVIDGIGNRQGCLVLLRDGMRIETQDGARGFRLGAEGAR